MDATLAEKIPFIPMIIILVAVHEFAHAWVADFLGDDTPRDEGRVTLNPLAHIDWIGTVAIPAVMIFLTPGFAMLGWGRPVRTNANNFQNPQRDTALVALAGPLANLFMAYLALLLIHFIPSDFHKLAAMFAIANVFMGIFNMIPIPQFDGWRILQSVLKLPEEIAYWGGGWFWMFALLFLINFPPFMSALGLLASIGLSLLSVAAGLR